MKFSDEVKCHLNEPHFQGASNDDWDFVPHNLQIERCCSYCGSAHPEDFYNYLCNMPEDGYVEPADQKYGYLHKIYFDNHRKFYTRHLLDIEDKETLNQLLLVLREKGKIKLTIKE